MTKEAKTKYLLGKQAIIAGVSMRVTLVARRGPNAPLRKIVSILDTLAVEYHLIHEVHPTPLSDTDLMVVVGGDKDILRTLHRLEQKQVPLLGVNEADGGGFLSEVNLSNFSEVFPRIVQGDYRVEEARRLQVVADGRPQAAALNEIAIFPARSATLFEYALNVDEEVVWRDYSDGIIISTATGSTAYAMSAGGPMILHDAPVFAAVSVNSMDITRRPLIIPASSKIRIEEITSPSKCEAIIDGTLRTSVLDSVEVSQHPQPARFVRLLETPKAMNKIAKKLRLAEELLRMPASAKLILKTLEYEGPLSHKDLMRKTMLPERTARLALNLLVEKRLVKRQPLLRDARQRVYQVA